jgi:hypothetical protein
VPSSTIRPMRSAQKSTSRTVVKLLAGLATLAVLAVISLLAVPTADPPPGSAAAEPVPARSGDLDDTRSLERFFDDNVLERWRTTTFPVPPFRW